MAAYWVNFGTMEAGVQWFLLLKRYNELSPVVFNVSGTPIKIRILIERNDCKKSQIGCGLHNFNNTNRDVVTATVGPHIGLGDQFFAGFFRGGVVNNGCDFFC